VARFSVRGLSSQTTQALIDVVIGTFAFIAAFNSKSFWGGAVCVLFGGFLWFLAVKEWRYQNRKR
jgi:hypothetical protein